MILHIISFISFRFVLAYMYVLFCSFCERVLTAKKDMCAFIIFVFILVTKITTTKRVFYMGAKQNQTPGDLVHA